ncbi:hypothetical protein CWE22_09465 [Pseudidiomarina aestuarii]|uniref:diguanylate cyclase n=1 Tax=Pseudidiomarina aestuarii TaxID=624146 RepID=A0A7Z6ZSE1_9GAMM|nr:diguanylate cyclase [Pseudidiomarina aestuarii]RUO39516.1 hypothetical protein CWE22_09465 [Pseudidiomarina aestuarii]
MTAIRTLWALLGLVCLIGLAPAAKAAVEEPQIYYQPETATTSFAQLLASASSSWEQIPQGEAVSFGYTPQAYWFKVEVAASRSDRILYLGYPLLDSVDIYFVQNGAIIDQLLVGDNLPFAQRPILNKNFVIPMASRAEQTIYLRVRTESSLRFPLEIWQPAEFMQAQQYQVAATGLYFGLLLCMVVYNFFNYLVTREFSFLNYSAYTLSIGLLMAGLDGTGYQYLWPNWIWLQDRIVTMIGSVVFIFASLVTAGVLQTAQRSPRLHRGLQLFIGIYSVTFVLSIFLPYATLIPYVLGLAVTSCIYLLATGISLWTRGLTYARIYTLALGSLLFAITINALGYLGLFESVFVQRYAIMAASALEVLLLSWVLALRFNESRVEQLALKEKLNTQLESMVAQRTEELEQVMGRLQLANKELEQKSNEDGLTGLYNRRFLNQEFKREFGRAKRTGRDLTLMMLDIDHFKPLNDSFGHLCGDQVLVELARLLVSQLQRATDTVYRYGGEEFVILLPDTDEHGAREIAVKIGQAVRDHVFKTDQGEMKITISIGVAIAKPDMYKEPTQLLAAADDALYRAKNSGRDIVKVTTQIHEPEQANSR